MVTPNPGKPKNWFMRHKVLSGIIGLIVLIAIISGVSGGGKKTTTSSAGAAVPTSEEPKAQNTSTTPAKAEKATTVPPTTIPVRHVTGTSTTLGAGTFTGGKDVPPGLYDVSAAAGQSGNFVVIAEGIDEILGTGGNGLSAVPKIRVKISDGDSIQIGSLSHVAFTPVTTPLVNTHTLVNLYAGNWTVGQDIGPGRYVATTTPGQSGNFVVIAEGIDEILGTGGNGLSAVPNVTVNLRKGDVIDIGSLAQVTMTPS